MTNIFITKQTLSNTTMNNTHDDYKSLDNKIIIKSIGGGFLQNSIQGSLIHRGIHPNPPNSKSLQKLVVVVHMFVLMCL